MLKIKFTAPLLFLLAAGLWSITGCASKATAIEAVAAQAHAISGSFKQVRQIEVAPPVRMAAFLNTDFGIRGGPNSEGVARTTTDGGQSWSVAGNSSACLYSFDIVDPSTIWECNNSDLRVTTDGGQTWSDKMRGMGQPGCKLAAVDGTTAWKIGPSVFEVTHDGGVTREELVLPGGLQPNEVAAIAFSTVDRGYLLGGNGTLFLTTDGGATWTEMPSLGLEKYGEMKLMANTGLPYSAIRFLDEQNGMLVMSMVGGGANKVLGMVTYDGGATWTEIEVPAGVGTPYLSKDGKTLTMVSFLNSSEITVFELAE